MSQEKVTVLGPILGVFHHLTEMWERVQSFFRGREGARKAFEMFLCKQFSRHRVIQ